MPSLLTHIMNFSRRFFEARRPLAVVVATALLAGLPGVVRAQAAAPGAAADAQSEADKAWKEVEKAARPPMPPAEWRGRPTREQLETFRAQQGVLAAQAADKANEFYKKYRRDLPENLWLEIKDLTGVSSAEAQSVEKEVRRWYLNDTEQIAGEHSSLNLSEKLHGGIGSEFTEDTGRIPKYQSIPATESIEIEEIPFAGKYSIKKPANEDIRKSWERLKRYMDIYLEDFREESSDLTGDNETSEANLV